MNQSQAKILTADEVDTMRVELPESWAKAAGMLKNKRISNPVKWQRAIRSGWERRIQKLEKLWNHGTR